LPEMIFLGLSAGQNSIPWTEIFNQPNQIQATQTIKGSDPAYIMYSSGSTGVPKGIVHTHNSGLSYAKLAAKLYQIKAADVIVSHSTLSYDISTFSYFSSLLAGATTLVLSDLVCMVPASLSAFLEQERATVWYSVPLALRQLLNFGALESRNLSSMRWVLYGGEPLPVNEANQLLKLFPNAMFSNVYGPAEVNQCTYYNFKKLDADAKEIPLGVVWEEAEYLLIDDDDEIISEPNKTGELVIHSSTMMTGYWQNRKPENEIYFFAKNPSAEKKYYRTGDLVSRGADELLYFVGRKDRQVKIQGYRVELKEIEYQLGRLDYLKDWAAIADKTSKDYAFIGVFAVLEKPVKTDTKKAINHHLKRFLPSYALPEKVIFLNEMPYASSGKKDYSKLNEYLKTTDEGQTKGVY